MSASDPTLRVPAVAANLLPLEILEARRSRTVRRATVSGLVVVVALLAGWYVVAKYQTSAAEDDLANAQSNAQALVRQQHAYADVVNTQAQSQAIQSQLSALFAGDVDWVTLLGRVRSAAPGGITVTAMNATAGGPEKAAGGSGQRVNPDQIGTVTITGTGRDKSEVAAYVDALGAVPGLADPYLTNATEADRSVQFVVRVGVVKAALGSRYAPKTSKGGG